MNPTTITPGSATCQQAKAATALLAFLMLVSPAMANMPWITDWAQASDLMHQDGRPAMLYFFNEKARPCQMMDNLTFADASVQAAAQGYIAVRLQMEDHPQLVRQFDIFKVPTVIFIGADRSRSIDQAIGYKPADQFVGYLRRHAASGVASAPSTRPVPGVTTSVAAPLPNMAMQPTSMRTEAAAPNTGAGFDLWSPLNALMVPGPGTTPRVITAAFPNAREVKVIGDFNDWRMDQATPLNRMQDGSWHVTIHLVEGVYEYMLMVDGQYQRDINNPMGKPNPYGGINSVMVVGNPNHLNPRIENGEIMWTYYDATATSVELAGTFNEWGRWAMYQNPETPGEWAIMLPSLPSGTYEYKFVVNGRWVNDPENFRIGTDHNRNNMFVVP